MGIYHDPKPGRKPEPVLTKIERTLRRLIIIFVLLALIFLFVIEGTIPDNVL